MSIVPKKNEIIISPSSVTTSEIAIYFDIETRALKRIFLKLKWIKRKYFLWLDTTIQGEEKGAKKENRDILWDRRILGDRELLLAVKAYQNIEEENIDYTNYKTEVYNQYKNLGYTVWNYEKEKGTYNKNIHFVVKQGKKVFLIHCKSNQKDITLNEILNLVENKKKFIEENPIFKIYNIKIKYIMSHFSLTEEAFKYLQKYKNSISYKIVK